MEDNIPEWWVMYMTVVISIAYGVLSFTVLGLFGLDGTVSKIVSIFLGIIILLVIFSPNWGRHRLRNKLRKLCTRH